MSTSIYTPAGASVVSQGVVIQQDSVPQDEHQGPRIDRRIRNTHGSTSRTVNALLGEEHSAGSSDLYPGARLILSSELPEDKHQGPPANLGARFHGSVSASAPMPRVEGAIRAGRFQQDKHQGPSADVPADELHLLRPELLSASKRYTEEGAYESDSEDN